MRSDPSPQERLAGKQLGLPTSDAVHGQRPETSTKSPAHDPEVAITAAKNESLIIFCGGCDALDFTLLYRGNPIVNDIDYEKSKLLPAGFIVINFQPDENYKYINQKINDEGLAARHAQALCEENGRGTRTERDKLLRLTTEACKYIPPEILAFFEKYGVTVDVGKSNLAFTGYDDLAKTINISPKVLDLIEPVESKDAGIRNSSINPIHVGEEIHEFGHAFNQLLTRLYPDSQVFKRETPEKKQLSPYKRLRKHSDIGEALHGRSKSGKSSIPLEIAATERAGLSIPFFVSMDEMSQYYISDYENQNPDEAVAGAFRQRFGVPSFECKLPEKFPMDGSSLSGENMEDFFQLHPLQLPEDAKLVRAFADKYASEPIKRMDRMVEAVIIYAKDTPELHDRSQHPERAEYRQRKPPTDVRILGSGASLVCNTLNWFQGNRVNAKHKCETSKRQTKASTVSAKTQIDDAGGKEPAAKATSLSQLDAPLSPSKRQSSRSTPLPDVSRVELPLGKMRSLERGPGRN